MNNKCVEQTVLMCRLICVVVVSIRHKLVCHDKTDILESKIFMPQSSKKLRGGILAWACPSVRVWVILCTRSRTVRDRILKFDM